MVEETQKLPEANNSFLHALNLTRNEEAKECSEHYISNTLDHPVVGTAPIAKMIGE